MVRVLFNYLLLVFVAALDYATGHEVHLGSMYLLVVAIASWNLPPRLLVFHALATVLCWSGAEWLSGIHYLRTWMVYWNAINHLGAVGIIATMVSKAKATLDQQQRLIQHLGQTLLKVSQFKEMVPICRLCHQLHLDDNYRGRLEELVSEGVDLKAVGDICPACVEARAAHVARISVDAYFSPTIPVVSVDSDGALHDSSASPPVSAPLASEVGTCGP